MATLNPKDLQLSTTTSSLKVLAEGSGTFTVPGLGGAGVVSAQATVPHGYGGDQLLYHISVKIDGANGRMIPWESNDGRVLVWGAIDTTYLYIIAENSDSSGYGTSAHTIDYFYRIFIP